MLEPLPASSDAAARRARHAEVSERVLALIDGEDDGVAVLATAASELFHAFAGWHWVGFYRLVGDELIVGPYQGGHGCTRIALSRGVCGAAARTRQTVRLDDVAAFPDHIACSATTVSEIVVPVLAADGRLLAVLDVDSDHPAAFDDTDQRALEALCARLGAALQAARTGVP
jgi:L-methionine (R)-S-oxide reductase